MCTALTFLKKDFYFGRNLDLEYGFGETPVIVPRQYPLTFEKMPPQPRHFAMIGMARLAAGVPLFAEAVNEKGLCLAGLNFPGNANYFPIQAGKQNVAPHELFGWLLGSCACVEEAEILLRLANIAALPFQGMPLAPLHWILADKRKCLVLEQTADGLHIFDNPVGVLTNNPPFPYQMMNLNNYLNLTAHYPQNRMGQGVYLAPYGQGLGAWGLPGDCSPASRFVRTVFAKYNSQCEEDERSAVTQFFHILGAAEMVRGCVRTQENLCDETRYNCCVNADKGIYYYKTYENSRITAIELFAEDLETDKVFVFPLAERQDIAFANRKQGNEVLKS